MFGLCLLEEFERCPYCLSVLLQVYLCGQDPGTSIYPLISPRTHLKKPDTPLISKLEKQRRVSLGFGNPLAWTIE